MLIHQLNRHTNTVHKLVRSQNDFIEESQIDFYSWKYVENIGDPILRHRAAEIPLDKINSSEIVDLIKQMKKVLRSFSLVGIAAPQIGVASRIIVIEASEQLKEKYPAAVYKARGCEILPMTVCD